MTVHCPESSGPRDVLRHYIGDIVYGANDGLVTTFTVVSGSMGAHLGSRVLIIIGLINLFADGFSMGASNYLAIRSTADAQREARGRVEPLMHALATFIAFVVAGAIPLLVWLLPCSAETAFILSAFIGAITLFAVGAGRHLVTDQGAFRSGMEMLGVGTIAAVFAYAAGALLETLVR